MYATHLNKCQTGSVFMDSKCFFEGRRNLLNCISVGKPLLVNHSLFATQQLAADPVFHFECCICSAVLIVGRAVIVSYTDEWGLDRYHTPPRHDADVSPQSVVRNKARYGRRRHRGAQSEFLQQRCFAALGPGRAPNSLACDAILKGRFFGNARLFRTRLSQRQQSADRPSGGPPSWHGARKEREWSGRWPRSRASGTTRSTRHGC